MNTKTTNKVRPIAIVGPECTGKSTLSESLAKHFQTQWAEEYARTYLDNLKRSYTQDDLYTIALGQLNEESIKSKDAREFLFCDTNLLVIKVWSDFKYGFTDERILRLWKPEEYALHFLTQIDVPWVFDPQREHPDKRDVLFSIYRQELEKLGVPFVTIEGNEQQRLHQAIESINKLL